jgi:molecular chaperone GrpE
LFDRKHPQEDDAKVEVESAAESSPESSAKSEESGAQGTLDAAALAEQLAKLQAEKAELWQTLIRRQADFENYRKRIERERREDSQGAVARVIEGLLPVLDAFERALAAHDDPAYEEYRKGFELIYRQLWDALSRQGLERIEAEGKVFDPHVHHAIERVESEEHPDGTVLEVLQPGYAFRGKVLRPTTVRVAIRPGEKTTKVREKAN